MKKIFELEIGYTIIALFFLVITSIINKKANWVPKDNTNARCAVGL